MKTDIFPEVGKIAIVSTAHLSENDGEMVWAHHPPFPFLMAEAGEGYLVHVPENDEEWDEWIEENDIEWSRDFFVILNLAKDEGMSYIKFDPDGPVIDVPGGTNHKRFEVES